ncbi:ATP-binding protein [Nocardia brasiliensis]|uniref:ATP-binding protein n=1 Tax=Nocardia brasiliensis TaxID=37326 RepID=UPI003D945007
MTVAVRVNGSGAAEVLVSDDGPGIDDDLARKLFERFVRADVSRARHSGNSGLGLAIAKAIAEAHDGTIHIAHPRDPTAFLLCLPLADPRV